MMTVIELKVRDFMRSRRGWHTVNEVAIGNEIKHEEANEALASLYFKGMLESMLDSTHGFGQKYRMSEQ